MRTALVLFLGMLPLPGEETWNELRLAGTHIGWSHETIEEATVAGQKVVRTIEEGKGWFDGNEFTWRTEYVETPEGLPVGLSYEGSQGSKPLPRIRGVRDGAGMKFVILEDDKVVAEVRDEGFLFPLGARLLVKSKGFAPGTKYTTRLFSVDDRKVVSVESEVVGEAEIALPDGPVKAHLVKQTQIGEEPIPFEVHYDDEGRVLCLNGTDIQMVLIRSTRERAIAVPDHRK